MMIEFFKKFPVLTDILTAIYRPLRQIILTLMLFYVSTYLFSLIFYYFYYQDIILDDG